MQPELKLKYRKNRAKLVNAMLLRDDEPNKGVYKQKSGESDNYCPLGLAFELLMEEFPDELTWLKIPNDCLYPIVKNSGERHDVETDHPAQDILGRWLGMSESSIRIVATKNDCVGTEETTWDSMAQVILNRPYYEREKLWNSKNIG